jgi:hypothetical protein
VAALSWPPTEHVEGPDRVYPALQIGRQLVPEDKVPVQLPGDPCTGPTEASQACMRRRCCQGDSPAVDGGGEVLPPLLADDDDTGSVATKGSASTTTVTPTVSMHTRRKNEPAIAELACASWLQGLSCMRSDTARPPRWWRAALALCGGAAAAARSWPAESRIY